MLKMKKNRVTRKLLLGLMKYTEDSRLSFESRSEAKGRIRQAIIEGMRGYFSFPATDASQNIAPCFLNSGSGRQLSDEFLALLDSAKLRHRDVEGYFTELFTSVLQGKGSDAYWDADIPELPESLKTLTRIDKSYRGIKYRAFKQFIITNFSGFTADVSFFRNSLARNGGLAKILTFEGNDIQGINLRLSIFELIAMFKQETLIDGIVGRGSSSKIHEKATAMLGSIKPLVEESADQRLSDFVLMASEYLQTADPELLKPMVMAADPSLVHNYERYLKSAKGQKLFENLNATGCARDRGLTLLNRLRQMVSGSTNNDGQHDSAKFQELLQQSKNELVSLVEGIKASNFTFDPYLVMACRVADRLLATECEQDGPDLFEKVRSLEMLLNSNPANRTEISHILSGEMGITNAFAAMRGRASCLFELSTNGFDEAKCLASAIENDFPGSIEIGAMSLAFMSSSLAVSVLPREESASHEVNRRIMGTMQRALNEWRTPGPGRS